MTSLALVYEHDQWLAPLFAELHRRGSDYAAIRTAGLILDPARPVPPSRLVFNRIAMSSFLRSPDHPIFFAQSLFAAWEAAGARIINGPGALAIDASKARQLALIAHLGHAVPVTRIVHRVADIVAAARQLTFPLVVKANIGGSGAGIMRYDSLEQLHDFAAEKMVPDSIDKVWLVQDYVPARDGRIMRLEVLDGQLLYALWVDGGGSFDLCPADSCMADPSRPTIRIERADPDPALVAAAEQIIAASGIDVGGIEVLIDDRDGVPRFYDINGFSNFVADPLNVLGWDPHVNLVDWIERQQRDLMQ